MRPPASTAACTSSKANCLSTSPAAAARASATRPCWARVAKGGKVSATDQGLAIQGADEVTLIVSAGTDWKDKEFAKLARRRLDAALAKPFDALRESAVADHRRYMERCQLTLPEGKNSKLPTPDRVRLQENTPDPSLAALYFQFGRHLVVSGSRPDSQLPTNLQGIWAEEYDTPWRGDFHSNINLQMNYWPVEAANLSDCHLPLLRFIQNVAQEGQKTAKAYFNAPGWMANHTQNPWYDTAPSCLPRLHRADLRRVARPAYLAALCLHAGQGVPARVLPRPPRRQPVHAGRAGRESEDP